MQGDDHQEHREWVHEAGVNWQQIICGSCSHNLWQFWKQSDLPGKRSDMISCHCEKYSCLLKYFHITSIHSLWFHMRIVLC